MQKPLGLFAPAAAFSGRGRHRSKGSSLSLPPILAFGQLAKPGGYDQRCNSQGPAPRQQLENLPPSGRGDGVEYVGRSRRTRRALIISLEYVKSRLGGADWRCALPAGQAMAIL
jgi:hypothetical protein